MLFLVAFTDKEVLIEKKFKNIASDNFSVNIERKDEEILERLDSRFEEIKWEEDYYEEDYNGTIYSYRLDEEVKMSIEPKWHQEEETDRILIDMVFKITDVKET